VVLPLVYLTVIALGVLLAAGRNPLARLSAPGGDLPRRPYLAAFWYGLLLGPMTLPCTGPIVMSAFVLGLAAPGFLLDGLAYFVAFGIGFGWPLIVIPVLATGASRRFTAWLGRRHLLLTRLSGLMLVAIGVFGLVVEVAPNVL
jgi:cytochrome c-type biogenesis protein